MKETDAPRSDVVSERPGGPKPTRTERPRASSEAGHSGYGMETLRPHLRDQLAMKDLLKPPAFPEGT